MSIPTATPLDDGWVALPGLFEASEIVGDATLEIRALPLLLVHDKTYYVVYARERPFPARFATRATRSAA